MKILVVNCGSSSLKYQLIDMETEEVMAKGYLERIGLGGSFLTHTVNGEKHRIEKEIANHEEAMNLLLEQLLDKNYGVISSLDEINAVGHRVVHGGEKFSGSVIITDEVINAIKECIPLAPLHNPAGITGIEACKKALPNVPMVGVFDTAFHQTMPKKAYLYGLPIDYYNNYKIRRYGFHGTSHSYVSKRVAEVMNKDIKDLKIIVCHIGQGASLCAVQNGMSVDTSMGLTPLGGIMMCARSGDLDPSIVTYLMKKENLSSDEMDKILNKESGVLGISGLTPDIRDIEKAASEGNKRAELALKAYDLNIAQYIAKSAVSMGGVDVIAFTAGVGENDVNAREKILSGLTYLGIEVDHEANKRRGENTMISTPASKVKVAVIPTNEELAIARETVALV